MACGWSLRKSERASAAKTHVLCHFRPSSGK
jgi:hypothetical protein